MALAHAGACPVVCVVAHSLPHRLCSSASGCPPCRSACPLQLPDLVERDKALADLLRFIHGRSTIPLATLVGLRLSPACWSTSSHRAWRAVTHAAGQARMKILVRSCWLRCAPCRSPKRRYGTQPDWLPRLPQQENVPAPGCFTARGEFRCGRTRGDARHHRGRRHQRSTWAIRAGTAGIRAPPGITQKFPKATFVATTACTGPLPFRGTSRIHAQGVTRRCVATFSARPDAAGTAARQACRSSAEFRRR